MYFTIHEIRYFLYVFVITFYSCQKDEYYYHGKVTDDNNNPLEDVIVTVENFKNKTKTDKKGYFKLNRSSERLEKLIFYKEGYKTDTIPTVWSQHGEALNYNFIEKDTTVVRLKILN